MSGEPENLILVYLRRIDGKIDRLTDDVQDLKHRVTSLEGQVASIRGDMAAMSLRIDRIETRLDRIERGLDLVPAPASYPRNAPRVAGRDSARGGGSGRRSRIARLRGRSSRRCGRG